tara:strand:+ start:337 stop:624 length:288 start_codon:yes stop_codon:yes gene_type:complete
LDYPLYVAIVHKKIEVISFEPSVKNLRILSRDISINNLNNKIKVITNPLLNIPNTFSTMMETSMEKVSAINTFNKDFNFDGKKNLIDYLIFTFLK